MIRSNTELTNDKDLFNSIKLPDSFAESIGSGFKDQFPFDDDNDPNFIKQFSEDFEDDGYKELKRLIKKYTKSFTCSEAFKKVVLLSNNSCDGNREYLYNVFDLENKSFSSGCPKAEWNGKGRRDNQDEYIPKSKEFMESLL